MAGPRSVKLCLESGTFQEINTKPTIIVHDSPVKKRQVSLDEIVAKRTRRRLRHKQTAPSWAARQAIQYAPVAGMKMELTPLTSIDNISKACDLPTNGMASVTARSICVDYPWSRLLALGVKDEVRKRELGSLFTKARPYEPVFVIECRGKGKLDTNVHDLQPYASALRTSLTGQHIVALVTFAKVAFLYSGRVWARAQHRQCEICTIWDCG